MRRVFFFLLVLSAQGWAGEREGTGGDPLVVEFYQRSLYALNHVRKNWDFKNAEALAFQEAWLQVRVDITDEPQKSAGRVLPDPMNPGKHYILLDRHKFQSLLDRADKIDICVFAAHEVLSTVGKDIGYEITRTLRIEEAEYQRWRKKYRIEEVSKNPLDRFSAISYSFLTEKVGGAWNHETRALAEVAAYDSCGHFDCQTVVWGRNNCVGLARAPNGNIAWEHDSSREAAKQKSLDRCAKLNGQACELVWWACSEHSNP